MRRIMVRYTVKPGRAEENEELVRAVYAELADVKPDDFQYATWKEDDGLSFVHVSFSGSDGDSPLNSLKSFQKFTESIGERCQVPPKFIELTQIGGYRVAEEA